MKLQQLIIQKKKAFTDQFVISQADTPLAGMRLARLANAKEYEDFLSTAITEAFNAGREEK